MKPWLKTSLWSLFGVSVITLLFVSQMSLAKKTTSLPKMHIHEYPGMSFLTEEELLTKLKRANLWNENTSVDSLKIKKIEDFIQHLNVVDSVNVYTNLGGNWEIDVQIRRPIVRYYHSQILAFTSTKKEKLCSFQISLLTYWLPRG